MARTPNRAELRGHALKTQSGAGLVSLFFGKQGELRGRSFDDQLRSFSCLGVLHNAVVAWNIIRIGRLVEQLRVEGHAIDDTTLGVDDPADAQALQSVRALPIRPRSHAPDRRRHPLNGGFRADVP